MIMRIGPYTFANALFVAPMAGVTDRPFRRLCKRLGAGHAYSEMAASNPKLWNSIKTTRRINHEGEPAPITVQIVGGDPEMLAESALFNIDKGAQIIDINMGCPAKKVCHVAAGSALLKDITLVQSILEKVVSVCAQRNIPVTLKTRTGWDHAHKNIIEVAKLAENSGIAAIAIHGRTRADAYNGEAEYDSIQAVKAEVSIPIIANGDIDSPEKAQLVLKKTKADALMIGRAAQGNPWIFQQILHYLQYQTHLAPPSPEIIKQTLLDHLQEHYQFYGEQTGVRTARKHISWYLTHFEQAELFWDILHPIESSDKQWQTIAEWQFLPKNSYHSLKGNS